MLELYERRIRSRSCQIQINIPRFRYADVREMVSRQLVAGGASEQAVGVFLDGAEVDAVLRRAHGVGASPRQFAGFCFVLNALAGGAGGGLNGDNFKIAAVSARARASGRKREEERSSARGRCHREGEKERSSAAKAGKREGPPNPPRGRRT
jgi:hypothetical protein